jgi:hypothetical protein
MQKLIESAINLLQFEFKRTIILDIDELKDYFTDIKYLHLLKHHTYCFHPLEQ